MSESLPGGQHHTARKKGKSDQLLTTIKGHFDWRAGSMDISTVTYFTIHLDDRTGQLASISATLLENDVSLHGIWGFGTSLGAAQVICIPADPSQFKNVAKNRQWNVREGACFYLHGDDKTGALVDVLNKIAEKDIFIVALDALAVDGKFGCYLWGSDEDHVELAQILGIRSALM